MTAPTCYVATTNHSWLPNLDEAHRPSLLVSYALLRSEKRRADWVALLRRICYRSWCLDSGAFSAWNSGTPISLDEYIPVARDLWQADPSLDMVFGLDVIGGTGWRETVRNCERMWAAGVPAVPTYHAGDPTRVLVSMARDYPKVALGGMVPLKGSTKRKFVDQCFSRIWPCAVHGFGVGTEELLQAVPWHSVDASSLESGPLKFGTWRSYGARAKLSVRGCTDLRAEVGWLLRQEAGAQRRWATEMGELTTRLRVAGWRGYV